MSDDVRARGVGVSCIWGSRRKQYAWPTIKIYFTRHGSGVSHGLYRHRTDDMARNVTHADKYFERNRESTRNKRKALRAFQKRNDTS